MRWLAGVLVAAVSLVGAMAGSAPAAEHAATTALSKYTPEQGHPEYAGQLAGAEFAGSRLKFDITDPGLVFECSIQGASGVFWITDYSGNEIWGSMTLRRESSLGGSCGPTQSYDIDLTVHGATGRWSGRTWGPGEFRVTSAVMRSGGGYPDGLVGTLVLSSV
jgi:hypothetical protein